MLDLLRTRRSIRKYQTRKIDNPTRELLEEAVLRCPSSKNTRPWEFIFVEAADLLKKLAKAKEFGSSFLKDAPLGIVVCGNETQSDVWVEDCAIAAVTLQYVAHSLGLGSCWIQIRNRAHSQEKTAEEYIQEVLGIPRHIKVEAIIALGYPAEEKSGQPKSKLQYDKIRRNHYS